MNIFSTLLCKAENLIINPAHAELIQWTWPTLSLELPIVRFRDIMMEMVSLVALCVENGKTARKCSLPWQ